MLLHLFSALLFFVYNVECMVCRQEELGEEVIINCSSQVAPYCCNQNGRVSCCSYDIYYRQQNGISTYGLIILIVSQVFLLSTAAGCCYIQYKRRKQAEELERKRIEARQQRLSRLYSRQQQCILHV